MNKTLTTLAGLLAALAVSAQTPYWQDVSVTSINAQTQRTEVVFFPSADQAQNTPFEQSPYYKSLNGEWDFVYYDSQKSLPADLKPSEWKKITVPGNWEFQGYGVPVYTNTKYEFAPHDPQPPTLPEDVPVGLYHRTFSIPSNWDGRTVYLNLCAAKSGVYVYVNDQEVGYCEDSKDLARFDISQYIKSGENDLKVLMHRWSTASYLEDQDFWRVSGFERDVYLSSEAVKQDFDFRVVATLDDKLRDGLFTLKIQGVGNSAFRLLDADGNTVLEGAGSNFSGRIPEVRQWTAETPNLYTLLIENNGEYTRFDVGFRRIEVKGDFFFVNGQKIKLKGVNFHEHNQYTGHYLTREDIKANLIRMRELNVNAIRTCHYPQGRAFYELCDSLGFYVYDEANIESHGMGYREETLAKRPEWYAKHLDRTLNMYYRTANYPCVVILSLGNEAGNGENFLKTYAVLKALEKGGQNRPVVYERAEGGSNTDFVNPMYPRASWFREQGENPPGKPCVPCEYAHAMGNSTGSFDLQLGYVYQYDNLQGGFIWDWIDQGVLEEDENGRSFWTYGGDYGANEWFETDWNFNCNGIVNPDINPHPGAAEVKHWYQDINITSINPASGEFVLHNRFYFKNLDGYDIAWRIEEDGNPISNGIEHFEGVLPQDSVAFRVEMPQFDADKAYYINFYAITTEDSPLLKADYTVADNQFLLSEAAPKTFAAGDGKPLKFKDKGDTYLFKGSRIRLVVDKATGYIMQYKVKGKNMIDPEFGLQPNFWRAPNDNDWGMHYPNKAGAWKDSTITLSSMDALANGIHAEYNLPYNCKYVVDYLIDRSGKLGVSASFKGSDAQKAREVMRIGFRARLPKDCDAFTYFGRGPVENYWDRNTAAFIGLYDSSAEAEYYPYVRPQETGHHTDCSYLKNKLFTVDGYPNFEFNYLRNSIEDLDPRDEKNGNTHQHVNDITPQDFVEMCIDYKMTGVGGYDSWGARPEPDRSLWSDKDYDFQFTITPR